MGKIIIELPEDIEIVIKAKNMDDAISELMKIIKIEKLIKFKGIGRKDYDFNRYKEEWYLQ